MRYDIFFVGPWGLKVRVWFSVLISEGSARFRRASNSRNDPIACAKPLIYLRQNYSHQEPLAYSIGRIINTRKVVDIYRISQICAVLIKKRVFYIRTIWIMKCLSILAFKIVWLKSLSHIKFYLLRVTT